MNRIATMSLNLSSKKTLYNQIAIPLVGYGLYQAPADQRATSLLYITTKLRDNDHGFDQTIVAFNDSPKKLGLDYVDLYLIHSPHGGPRSRLESWRAMEQLHREGRVKSIGVSNYGVRHLQELLEVAQVKPAVNQIEFHPGFNQHDSVKFCRARDIAVAAYSPLAWGKKSDDPTLTKLATKYDRTWAQILVRWSIQRGYVALVETVNEAHLATNIDLFDFDLSDADMKALDDLHEDLHV
ncbi:hypothetical protein IWQ60_011649, partial [Tieghemiomyces parasiticus]